MPEYVRKVVKVPAGDAEWFERAYQQYGAWTWFVQSALANFREAHEITPEEVVASAVRELLFKETP